MVLLVSQTSSIAVGLVDLVGYEPLLVTAATVISVAAVVPLTRPGTRRARRRLERSPHMTLRAWARRVLAGHGHSVPPGDRPRSEASAGWTRDGRLGRDLRPERELEHFDRPWECRRFDQAVVVG